MLPDPPCDTAIPQPKESFVIITPELQPIRVAPAAIIFSASANVLMPPDALTPIVEPTVCRMSTTSATVAPLDACLDEISASGLADLSSPFLSLVSQETSFQNNFDNGTTSVRFVYHNFDVIFNQIPIT